MTLSFRKKLFFLFVLIFIALGTGVLYYSQGFRLDLSSFSIKMTGGVYIETRPTEIAIALNQVRYQDKPGLFGAGTLFSNIIPKKYRVIVSKDGYYNYEKNIEVFPSQVVRLLNVRLVPAQTFATSALGTVDGDRIIDVSPGNQIITLDANKGIYYLYTVNSTSTSEINLSSKIAGITRQKVTGIRFYPQSDNTFIITTQKGINAVNLISKTITPLESGTVALVKIEKNNLYAILSSAKTSESAASATSSRLTVFDLVLNNLISDSQIPFPASSLKDIDIGDSQVAILLNGGGLWLYQFSDGSTVQLAHAAVKALFSDNNAKLFYQDNDNKMFVYLFDDELPALNATKRTALRLNFIDPVHIQDIWWFDPFHLLVQYPDNIMLAEVTSLEPDNQFPLLSASGNVFYSSQNQTFYILTNNTLTTADISGL